MRSEVTVEVEVEAEVDVDVGRETEMDPTTKVYERGGT